MPTFKDIALEAAAVAAASGFAYMIMTWAPYIRPLVMLAAGEPAQ
jgi:hypothetical protein